jgi:hypothetical protein
MDAAELRAKNHNEITQLLVQSGNLAAMTYWARTGFTHSDIQKAAYGLDGILSVRFRFFIGEALDITVSTKVHKMLQGHFPTVVHFIKEILGYWKDNMPMGGMFVWLEDGIWASDQQRIAPIFAFCKKQDDHYSLLMPDPAFIGSHGYRDQRAEIDEIYQCTPWNRRKKTAFWRGAGSGLTYFQDRWREAPRIKLCTIANELGSDILDAKITKVVTYDSNSAATEIEHLGILSEPVPFNDFLNYRYVIDVDGESCAWQSFFLKLCSGSTVIKVMSDNEQWYYSRLRPWEHFIPVRPDLSDLEGVLKWVYAHDDACETIAYNAREVMKTITYEQEMRNAAATIEELFTYYRKE